MVSRGDYKDCMPFNLLLLSMSPTNTTAPKWHTNIRIKQKRNDNEMNEKEKDKKIRTNKHSHTFDCLTISFLFFCVYLCALLFLSIFLANVLMAIYISRGCGRRSWRTHLELARARKGRKPPEKKETDEKIERQKRRAWVMVIGKDQSSMA